MSTPVRLTSLTLCNFKSVGEEPQTVLFRPITLLFGPNSAGKSSILHALHYAREILCHHNLDPHYICDDSLDLGGFHSFVHGHDLDRTVRLALAFDCHATDRRPRWLPAQTADDLQPVIDRIRHAVVEIDIRFSAMTGSVQVSRYATRIGDEPFATIEASPDGRRIEISDIATTHPILFDPEAAGWPDGGPAELQEIIGAWFGWLRLGNGTPEDATRRLKPIRLEARAFRDALPGFDRGLPVDPDYVREQDNAALSAEAVSLVSEEALAPVQRFETILSLGLLWPGQLLAEALAEWVHLGPMRALPRRDFAARANPEQARWTDGLAAWDLLGTSEDGGLVNRVNGWLGAGRFNTGYQLRVTRFREWPVESLLLVQLERGEVLDVDVDLVRAELQSLPIRSRIQLRREGSVVDLLPSDVGIGLSQLIPIIVAVLAKHGVLIAIEQPELHNHPAVQVGFGDLLIRASAGLDFLPEQGSGLVTSSAPLRTEPSNGTEEEQLDPVLDHRRQAAAPILLVETHSEHLILRLLRRIRETTEGELPPGEPPLAPDGVAVHWVEPKDDGVRIARLRITPDGDFIDRWPRGFFEERGDELFS